MSKCDFAFDLVDITVHDKKVHDEAYQQGRADAIDEVIKYVKEMSGYTDWTDGGCTYDELVDRDCLLKWLKEQKNDN